MSDELSWGGWLRQRRRAHDLTQEQLGELVGCAAETIRRFEGDRLRPSRDTAQRLAEQLGFVDGERAAFVRAARSRPAPSLAPEDSSAALVVEQPFEATARDRHPLPAPATPLVGRVQDVAFACTLLRQTTPRLLTLTGAGGTGKTRVAVEVARSAAADFRDGVVFVALDALSDPALVGNAIGQALGVVEQGGQPIEAGLTRFLRDKQLLLVLDNFEQILPAAPLVAALLAAAPELKVLVTSRAPLHLTGEHECPVLPLPVPDLDRLPPPDALAQVPAIELFVQRVQAVQPAFQLSAASARDVARICCRLDGIPLALILAAAWCKLLRPADLLARLSSSLVFLTAGARDLPARQQTLRATIEWSHRSLTAGQQVLFRRLAVFTGGASLDAVEEICAGDGDLPGDVLTDLQRLLDANLVQRMDAADGAPRVRMLETIREYALEQLTLSGEQRLLRRHASYFCRLAELAEPETRGPRQLACFERLETESDNLRAALRWALDQGEPDIAARICFALGFFWYFRSRVGEARQWLAEVLPHAAMVAPLNRANVLFSVGLNAWLSGATDASFEPLEQSVALYRQLGDRARLARALNHLAGAYSSAGNKAEARARLDESMAILHELEDGWGLAQGFHHVGFVGIVEGDVAAARDAWRTSADLYREAGDAFGAAIVDSLLGCAAASAGDYAAAYRSLRRGAVEGVRANNTSVLGVCLVGLAAVTAALGSAEHVAQIYGALSANQEEMNVPFAPSVPVRPGSAGPHDDSIASARAQLGDAAFEAAWAEGRAMTLEQAVAYALDVDGGGHDVSVA